MAFSSIKMTYKEEEQGAYNKKQVNIPGNRAASLKKVAANSPLFS